jgi:hypothetical protein
MRTCPNGKCRKIHDDAVGQCPGCGAPMSRTPDAVMDVNTHLYGLRANAGTANYAGGGGRERRGDEPMYPDTLKVMDTARDVVAELMGGTDGVHDGDV